MWFSRSSLFKKVSSKNAGPTGQLERNRDVVLSCFHSRNAAFNGVPQGLANQALDSSSNQKDHGALFSRTVW